MKNNDFPETKKIECLISLEKSQEIDKICQKEGYTRAEFNRRSVDLYLEFHKKHNIPVPTIKVIEKS